MSGRGLDKRARSDGRRAGARPSAAPGHRRPPSGERRDLVITAVPRSTGPCSWVLHFSSYPSRERRRLHVVGSHRFAVRAARAVKWGGPAHNGYCPFSPACRPLARRNRWRSVAWSTKNHRNAVGPVAGLIARRTPSQTPHPGATPGKCATPETIKLPNSSLETSFHPNSRPPSGPRGGETNSFFSNVVKIR